MRTNHPSPLLHAKFAILTHFDIKVWTEPKIDPGQDRKMQEAFFQQVMGFTPDGRYPTTFAGAAKPQKTSSCVHCSATPPTHATYPHRYDNGSTWNAEMLDMVRTKLLDSVNVRPSAGIMLKDALLLTT